MDRIWSVEVAGKPHVIEADYGSCLKDPDSNSIVFQSDGKLVVDGAQVQTWKDLPKEVKFAIDGTPALLKKQGGFTQTLELSINGKKIKPDKK